MDSLHLKQFSTHWRSRCKECKGTFEDGTGGHECVPCLSALSYLDEVRKGIVVDGTRTGKPCGRCNETIMDFIELPFCGACLSPERQS